MRANSSRQVVASNSTLKTNENCFRLIVVCTIKKCDKPTEAIDTTNDYEIPSDQFVVCIYMPKMIDTFDIVNSSL